MTSSLEIVDHSAKTPETKKKPSSNKVIESCRAAIKAFLDATIESLEKVRSYFEDNQNEDADKKIDRDEEKEESGDQIDYATRLFPLLENQLPAIQNDQQLLAETLELTFGDQEIQDAFKNTDIRHTTMCGKVSQELLCRIHPDKKELLKMLAIGDADVPEFAKKTIDELRESAIEQLRRLIEKEGYSYDLAGKGPLSARLTTLEYLDRFNGFSEATDLNELAKNMTFVPGGMQGLRFVAEGMCELAEAEKISLRFIQPDNSFPTWLSIVKNLAKNREYLEMHTLPTTQDDRLHLTEEDIDHFYGAHGKKPFKEFLDVIYLTPSGNPSGTVMTPSQLEKTVLSIYEHNPHAIILLDQAYVCTLLNSDGPLQLMSGITKYPEIFQNCVYINSFSKTHAIPRMRIANIICPNETNFKPIQNLIMSFTAGISPLVAAWSMAIAKATPAQNESIKRLHQFWSDERVGLYHYLLKSGRFADLFDPNQSHLQLEDIGSSGNLYLFPKMAKGVTPKDIAIRTNILGVKVGMNDKKDNYIRFAVGTIKEPTFSKFMP